jgi:hypothetical protein
MSALRFQKNGFVPILYNRPAFEAFDGFSNFVESITSRTSKTCQDCGSNPCRGATSSWSNCLFPLFNVDLGADSHSSRKWRVNGESVILRCGALAVGSMAQPARWRERPKVSVDVIRPPRYLTGPRTPRQIRAIPADQRRRLPGCSNRRLQI